MIASECACATGCPACIHSSECSEHNKVLDKRGSLMVLEFMHGAFASQKKKKETCSKFVQEPSHPAAALQARGQS